MQFPSSENPIYISFRRSDVFITHNYSLDHLFLRKLITIGNGFESLVVISKEMKIRTKKMIITVPLAIVSWKEIGDLLIRDTDTFFF